MSSRRDFLKGSLALGVAFAAGQTGQAQAGTAFPPALVYTKDNLGRWAGKEGAHLPKVTVGGGEGHDPDAAPDDPAAFHRQTHAPHPGGKDHRREDFHCRRPEGGIDLRASCGLQGRALGHELLQPARSLADGIDGIGPDGGEGVRYCPPHPPLARPRTRDNFSIRS